MKNYEKVICKEVIIVILWKGKFPTEKNLGVKKIPSLWMNLINSLKFSKKKKNLYCIVRIYWWAYSVLKKTIWGNGVPSILPSHNIILLVGMNDSLQFSKMLKDLNLNFQPD